MQLQVAQAAISFPNTAITRSASSRCSKHINTALIAANDSDQGKLRRGDHALDAAIDLAIKVREQAQIDALERKERRR